MAGKLKAAAWNDGFELNQSLALNHESMRV
jgi:hypothetical protein